MIAEQKRALKQRAREFAAGQPVPRFHADYPEALALSERMLAESPILAECRKLIGPSSENMGHGLKHAEAVARDAGALVRVEAEARGIEYYNLLMLAVQTAALLHDIKRAEKHHALAGAVAAAEIIKGFDMPDDLKGAIVLAIQNHEAFKQAEAPPDEISRLISDVLYDADKFRWGPDNFTHTLWLMMESAGGPTLESLHRRFLQNLDYIRRIKETFRTGTGRLYGPEFIDQGIEIGKAIFRELTELVGGPRMELITSLDHAAGCCGRPGVITLGNFDGLHVGHQTLVRQVVGRAREIGGCGIVFTFHPHPLKILSPKACPPLISTYDEKVAMFQELGIDILLMIPFTPDIAAMSARDFAKTILKDTLNASEVYVGFNYRFGRGREGTVDTLRELGDELGFRVNEVREVAVDGEVISSTKIRDLLRAGDVEHAARLLGRPYAITGRVVGGDRRGRLLGFPTANLEPVHEIMPYPGVYAVRAFVEGSQFDGVVNAGFRPTFNKRELCVEAHLFDFSRDIYGKEITIFFVKKIRDEKRFESLEALTAQIRKDVIVAKEILA